MGPVIVIVILLLVGYLVLVRPSRRRQRSHEAMQDSVEVGDEIITAGGIHAVVRRAEPEELQVEIAPNVVVRLDRRAVAAVAQAEPAELAEERAAAEADQAAR
jgi:preprotein translocase subunit YajC